MVDDDARIRELLQRYLTEQGCNIKTASDCKVMDTLLKVDSCDLLVLDLMLPGEDGLAICGRLRGKNV